MIKILWIAPNFNHYKARFLSRLVNNFELKMTILAGARVLAQGHRPDRNKYSFGIVEVKIPKKYFHWRLTVYICLLRLIFQKRFHVVLMPFEKKHFPLIVVLFLLKFLFQYKLVSYNHPMARPKNEKDIAREKMLTRFLFTFYDRIIFYTQHSREWAIDQGLIREGKAFFANNTLDTKTIWENYSFEINTSEPKTLLFIGRLTPNKNIDVLLAYYGEMKRRIPGLRLIVIGDGPMAYKIKEAAQNDDDIVWRGAVIDEPLIAKDMSQSHVVFVPGASGLSIVHAFCYGKPYVTLSSKKHGPEISYFVNGVNGLLLSERIKEDCNRFASFLLDSKSYQSACHKAFEKAKELSIENWCEQMKRALDF